MKNKVNEAQYIARIDELEEENTDLKQKNYVMSSLLNGKDKEIVEKLQRLQDMQNECDTCIRQDCEVAKLEKEIADLKTELDRVQCDECMDLQDENIKLEEENAELESKLASIKYLDKKEVRKIFKGYCLSKRYDMQPFGIGLKGFGIEPFITAICKLAIPEINRDRIKKELNHENENLISVIFEIISRCFIDYEKLPKAEDICGILKSDKIIKKLGENNV